tara:strand:+ start:3190 stop:3735 length:546 start_codon:yes stop_codon:yes gene_type:complete
MASELEVTTIRGLSSGANANHILVPSGQTLHAPGHVVNVTHVPYSSYGSISPNTSYVNTATLGTVTTKLANSKIMIVTDIPIQTQAVNCIWSVALRSSIDSYASNLCQKHFVRYSTNNHETGFTGLTFTHSANQPAGTAITYRYYVKGSNTTSGSGWYCTDAWGVANATYQFDTNMLEIAQ